MRLEILNSIDTIPAARWNAVSGTGNPFLRHEFMLALERNGCVGEQHGWLPRHLAAFDNNNDLVGAVPMYLKDNSYGEFVFDWSWAEAYQRAGLSYYPKAVVAIPYTPTPGPRILVHPQADRDTIASALIELARNGSQSENLSSLHWLFTDKDDTERLRQQGFLIRLGCQFHWKNRGYRDFEAFLSSFSARKRKKVRRERRYVQEQHIDIITVHGHEATDLQLQTMHDFYRITFEKKWGHPTLTLDFFREIAQTMGEQLVFFIAEKQQTMVAGAICFRGNDTLYGRHWGCYEDYHSLHFEACYYQGIEYCIKHGLNVFQPGAQGEHKISRGFLPTPTWSAHWIADDRFRGLIADFLEHETSAMNEYIEELNQRSPFREVVTA
ncbi:GNAT family N-acetyltransferase [Thiogranum longum]|nr:GNAT family N-acetyltransferase [Thiogranum longum]